jgi:hypothetical protein
MGMTRAGPLASRNATMLMQVTRRRHWRDMIAKSPTRKGVKKSAMLK